MLSEKEIIELQAQLEAMKKRAVYAEKRALKFEEKYKESESSNKEKDKIIAEKDAEIKQISGEYKFLKEQLLLSKKKIFGSSAEKIAEGYEQLNFFNEAEIERAPLLPEPKIEEITYTRKKKSKKKSFPEKYGDLPKEEIIVDIPAKEKICEKCGEEMTLMRYEIRRELKIVPAKVSVVEYKRPVYVCRNCDKNGTESNFKTAEAVPALIDHSIASPSIMAWVMHQKFCNAMPLYRQEQEFKRMGVKLNRSTLANWMIAGAKLMKPIYDEMQKELVSRDILHADETPLEVLKHPKHNGPLNAYMWVYRTSVYEKHPVILYKYEIGRSGDFADKFLKGFKGYLHCDGWSGYDKVKDAKRCGCWAHLRRYFYNAFELQEDKKDFSTTAGQALIMIGRIFSAEKLDPKKPDEKTPLSFEEIAKIRKETSKQLAEEFFDFCENEYSNTLPKSVLGKAITYALNQKEPLMRFLDDPRIELTNNAAERAVKPFVIGRKNWLFCNTPSGADSSAVIYSIIESAKANGIDPYKYLVYVFDRLCLNCEVSQLMPWNVEI